MSSFPKADPVQALSESRSPGPSYAYAYRKELEDLQKRQYWRSEWRMEDPIPTRFDIGDASSLGMLSFRSAIHPTHRCYYHIQGLLCIKFWVAEWEVCPPSYYNYKTCAVPPVLIHTLYLFFVEVYLRARRRQGDPHLLTRTQEHHLPVARWLLHSEHNLRKHDLYR